MTVSIFSGGAPRPPASLTATPTINTLSKVDLTWVNKEPGAQTSVYRNGVLVTTVAIGVTGYQDTGLSPNVSYTYTVRHFRNGVVSAASTSAVALTHDVVISYTGTSAGSWNLRTAGFLRFLTANGLWNFTLEVNCTLTLYAAAGGGGGQGVDNLYNSFSSGYGGGGGATSRGVMNVALLSGKTYQIRVGAAGAAGTVASPATDTTGGETYLYNVTDGVYLLRLGGGWGGHFGGGPSSCGPVLTGTGNAGGMSGSAVVPTSPGGDGGSVANGAGGGAAGGTPGGDGGAGNTGQNTSGSPGQAGELGTTGGNGGGGMTTPNSGGVGYGGGGGGGGTSATGGMTWGGGAGGQGTMELVYVSQP